MAAWLEFRLVGVLSWSVGPACFRADYTRLIKHSGLVVFRFFYRAKNTLRAENLKHPFTESSPCQRCFGTGRISVYSPNPHDLELPDWPEPYFRSPGRDTIVPCDKCMGTGIERTK